MENKNPLRSFHALKIDPKTLKALVFLFVMSFRILQVRNRERISIIIDGGDKRGRFLFITNWVRATAVSQLNFIYSLWSYKIGARCIWPTINLSKTTTNWVRATKNLSSQTRDERSYIPRYHSNKPLNRVHLEVITLLSFKYTLFPFKSSRTGSLKSGSEVLHYITSSLRPLLINISSPSQIFYILLNWSFIVNLFF